MSPCPLHPAWLGTPRGLWVESCRSSICSPYRPMPLRPASRGPSTGAGVPGDIPPLPAYAPSSAAMPATERCRLRGSLAKEVIKRLQSSIGVDCRQPTFGRPRASGRGPTGRYHAQALRRLDCRDAGRCSPGQSGQFCADVAIWVVAAGSGRPVALGRRLGSRRPLGAPWPKLGLSFAPPGVAKCTVGKRRGRTLGMARRLGCRWHLGAPGSELGLPLAVGDSRRRAPEQASEYPTVVIPQ